MNEFKVGDKVRCLSDVGSYFGYAINPETNKPFKDGDICKIITIDNGDNSVRLNGDYGTWVHMSEIEKVAYTNVKQSKLKGSWTKATTSRVITLILMVALLVSLISGGVQSVLSSILAVLTFVSLVNDEMCMYEFKERQRIRKGY